MPRHQTPPKETDKLPPKHPLTYPPYNPVVQSESDDQESEHYYYESVAEESAEDNENYSYRCTHPCHDPEHISPLPAWTCRT